MQQANTPILVLADDLTGAAEIAGIGIDHGLTTQLATGPAPATSGMLVIDSDSRPLSAADAAARIHSLLPPQSATPIALFKKTDSVLRGQVLAELAAIMAAHRYPRALLLPQNPSKNRVIVAGQYLIDNVPLDQTPFRHDPEYPRTSSRVLELLSPPPLPLHLANATDLALPQAGIIIGNAASTTDMQLWAERVNAHTLLAGGADSFRALLEVHGHVLSPPPPVDQTTDHTLLVCGSAAANSRKLVSRWQTENLPVCPMPQAAVESAAAIASWAATAGNHLAAERMAILAITHPLTPHRAVAFRQAMAQAVAQLVTDLERSLSLRLIIEGGATAAAISAALHWDRFLVLGNISPGVVALRPLAAQHVLMIIKPGSYPWPQGFPERT